MLNFDGKVVTPSVVGIDDSGNVIVGEKAEAQLLLARVRDESLRCKIALSTQEEYRVQIRNDPCPCGSGKNCCGKGV